MKSKFPAGLLFRITISVVSIFLILYFLRDELPKSYRILRYEVLWYWVAVGCLFHFAALAIQALRLKIVLRLQGISLRFMETLYLNFIGLFFNLFFPSAVGGDLAKAYYAYKHSGKKLEATTSVILDRLLGFAALILMAVGMVLAFDREIGDPKIDRIVYFFLGLMMVTALFFGSKRIARRFSFLRDWIPSAKWRDRVTGLYHTLYSFKEHKVAMLSCILLSFACQFFFILVYHWLALALGVELNIWLYFILVPVISIMTMAPSLGGLGVREAGMVYFFSRYMSQERSLALSLLLDILIYGFSFSAGILYSLRGGLKGKLIQEMEELK